MKNKIKGFILGVVCTVLMISTVAYGATKIETIEVNLNSIQLFGNKKAIAKVDENYILSNGEEVPYSILYKGTTYLPIRKVSEIFEKEIIWEGDTRSIHLNDKKDVTVSDKENLAIHDKDDLTEKDTSNKEDPKEKDTDNKENLNEKDTKKKAEEQKEPTYTVTYDGNGHTVGAPYVNENVYKKGDTVPIYGPNTIAKKHAWPVGWTTNPDGTGDYYDVHIDMIMPAHNVILYAKWQEDPKRDVTYYGNGSTSGEPPVDNTMYYTEEPAKVLGQGTLKRNGYKFKGWCRMQDGSAYIYEEDSWYYHDNYKSELYAQWELIGEPITYKVIYNGNGRTPLTTYDDPRIYHDNSSFVVVSQAVLNGDEPNFICWNTSPDGTGTDYYVGQSIPINGKNYTLYAKYGK